MWITNINGEILRTVRKKIGWTQNQLAEYLSIDNTLICRWEKGERPIPDDILRVVKRAKRLNKSDIKLVNFSPDKKTSVGEFILNINSSIFLGEKNTILCQEQTLIAKYSGNSMEAYVLEAYIDFRKSNRRFPTAGDFASRVFKEITQSEVLHYFGSLREAKSLAGELMKSRRAKRKKKREILTFPAIQKEAGKNIQTAITYIDSDNENNWLKALYPERNFDTYKSKVKQRNFTWRELFKYRPESERLVITDT